MHALHTCSENAVELHHDDEWPSDVDVSTTWRVRVGRSTLCGEMAGQTGVGLGHADDHGW